MNFKNKKEQQLDILEKLVEANQDYLFRFAYFRVGSREVAEESRIHPLYVTENLR